MKKTVKPNFLYIGASKSGSSWIYECLREHPEVFVPKAKDLQFFDRYYDKGLEWYLKHFKGKENYKAIGELSHDYFLFPNVAEKIYNVLGPDIKFILSLREPIDKMKSSYKYALSTYLPKEIDFNTFFWQNEENFKVGKFRDHNMTKESALYAKNLKSFFELFPKESFLILFFDELKENPANFIRKIFKFLNVDESFEPIVLNQKVLASQKARNSAIAHFVYDFAGLLRKLGMANLVGIVKRNSFFNRLLYNQNQNIENILIEDKERMKSFFSNDIKLLERMTGLRVPDNWK